MKKLLLTFMSFAIIIICNGQIFGKQMSIINTWKLGFTITLWWELWCVPFSDSLSKRLIENGHIRQNIDLTEIFNNNASAIELCLISTTVDTKNVIHLNALNGKLYGTYEIKKPDGWENWVNYTIKIQTEKVPMIYILFLNKGG